MKILIVAGILLVLLVAVFGGRLAWQMTPTKGEPVGPYDTPNSALLVIDLQEDLTGVTASSPYPYKDADALIASVNTLINLAQTKGCPVVYIRQEYNSPLDLPFSGGRLAGNTPGAAIDSRMNVLGSNIFVKVRSDAFSNPSLERFLAEKQIDHLYVAGIDAAACVHNTSKGALNRGYKVTAISDAITTMDTANLPMIFSLYEQEGIELLSSEDFAAL